MNLKTIDTTICGALCLLVGWGASTILHEMCHLAAAEALGIPASLGDITLATGYVTLYHPITDIQMTIIALAGSLGLVIAGVLLVRLSGNPAVRMIGIVFLCRAWTDTLPITGLDGGLIAGSSGYVIAILIVIAEVLICGSVILDTIQKGAEG